jgi:hypothetical protein
MLFPIIAATKLTNDVISPLSNESNSLNNLYNNSLDAEDYSTDPVSIFFNRVIGWDDIFEGFSKHTSDNESFKFILPGLVVRGIPCNPSACKFNVSFQPEYVRSRGGVCGVDIEPTLIDGALTRIFMLPRLPDISEKENEGPRGVVATTSGIVFDLNGGCNGCIKVFPKVGQVLIL